MMAARCSRGSDFDGKLRNMELAVVEPAAADAEQSIETARVHLGSRQAA